jgi:hypothetical protein
MCVFSIDGSQKNDEKVSVLMRNMQIAGYLIFDLTIILSLMSSYLLLDRKKEWRTT